jgi:hypothetical protein
MMHGRKNIKLQQQKKSEGVLEQNIEDNVWT